MDLPKAKAQAPNPREKTDTDGTRTTGTDGDDQHNTLPQPTQSEREKAPSNKQKRIPIGQQIRTILFPEWCPKWCTINWLLFAVPVGITLNYVKGINPLAVFIVNFLAIIPLAGILSFATEELSTRVGETLGGLLNATFGNAVELIVGIIALVHGEILVVQTSMLGSMLSNLLIVLGMCFFFGGLNRVEQSFNVTVTQITSSLLVLSVGSLVIPTAFAWNKVVDPSNTSIGDKLSRGTAIVLLVVYACYLFFQLKSHKDMYNAPSEKARKRAHASRDRGDTFKAIAVVGGIAAAHSGGDINKQCLVHEPELEPEPPSLSLVGSLFTLSAATALIGVCAESLVSSIGAVTCLHNVSEYFVGLILLPIVGNAAEHTTAVIAAIKDRTDLAINVALGSSIQIALLVLPLMVVVGWILNADMTLVFDPFQVAILFVAVILVSYLVADAKSNWLEGVLLMALYLIIVLAVWFIPLDASSAQCQPGVPGSKV